MTAFIAPSDVVAFWKEAGPDKWFAKDEAFDAEFRARGHDLHLSAARRECDDWIAAPETALALLILLDQYPRNSFRGTAHQFATDPLALMFANQAVARGHHLQVGPELKNFLLLPFEHSERLEDQDRYMALIAGDAELEKWGRLHRDIIVRFGRFPHRNPALGRATTPDEQAFLDDGGFGG
ncbi:MAG: DUF924 family protein [Alphaproteobacteria bacterium]|uniref:DUF924 family protein n=1 Tax=Brevundimonas sp. TaxID=1871086 RepID=UPI001A2BE960|nr:DUF924 family protein [Brevundimonas sp.]MBU1273539.1 DUF924 family protein [Alphaproteobacteria bacterium]MBJ7319831.1 DUF924 family protein [Brevundimonas sp.]MBU1521297.1 DUF924 family protein [Alphaproteobacteria bacterium]MBU2031082.1 DUF924 family protein [Alphaproteobacteria bacterium]MBU2164013.1 DUF924 family protein [Alphaproteobacteria bacterium]